MPGKILSRIPLDFVHTPDIISLGHCMTKQRVLLGSMVMSKPWGGHGLGGHCKSLGKIIAGMKGRVYSHYSKLTGHF